MMGAISEANRQLLNKIGGLMMHVYLDAKKVTLSATFPARVVVSMAARKFDFNMDTCDFDSVDFQYLTPAAHRDFLECIVEVERDCFLSKLQKSKGLSLRCDGSVDKS